MIPEAIAADGTNAISPTENIPSGLTRGDAACSHGGDVEKIYGSTKDNFAPFGIRIDQRTLNIIPGQFESTLTRQARSPIAFPHINCDSDEHVKQYLSFVYERLTKFGVVIVEDYNDWPACRIVVDEFCSQRDDLLLVKNFPHAVLLKLAA